VVGAQAVVSLAELYSRNHATDDAFIASARSEFPTVATRLLPPQEIPAEAPHLVLQSTSSTLAVSAAQAEMQVRFYGDLLGDLDGSLAYVRRKVQTIRAAWIAAGARPSVLGVVITANVPFDPTDEFGPAKHILNTHLSIERGDDAPIQDASARVAIRLADRLFFNVSVSNYELRTIRRPILPGMQQIMVKSWDAEVTERGIEVKLDINNRLEAVIRRSDPDLDDEAIETILGVAGRGLADALPEFVASGRLDTAGVLHEVST
jgi:hypothetical protein